MPKFKCDIFGWFSSTMHQSQIIAKISSNEDLFSKYLNFCIKYQFCWLFKHCNESTVLKNFFKMTSQIVDIFEREVNWSWHIKNSCITSFYLLCILLIVRCKKITKYLRVVLELKVHYAKQKLRILSKSWSWQ